MAALSGCYMIEYLDIGNVITVTDYPGYPGRFFFKPYRYAEVLFIEGAAVITVVDYMT